MFEKHAQSSSFVSHSKWDLAIANRPWVISSATCLLSFLCTSSLSSAPATLVSFYLNTSSCLLPQSLCYQLLVYRLQLVFVCQPIPCNFAKFTLILMIILWILKSIYYVRNFFSKMQFSLLLSTLHAFYLYLVGDIIMWALGSRIHSLSSLCDLKTWWMLVGLLVFADILGLCRGRWELLLSLVLHIIFLRRVLLTIWHNGLS